MAKANIYRLYFCIMVLITQLFALCIADACWAFLSVDELVEKSDSIVIGEIVKKTGTIKIEQFDEITWEVKVKYYLKGQRRDGIIIVTTPPTNVSTHYNLDEWGKQVLLFLHSQESFYTPFSPQAVIPVALDEELLNKFDNISGEELAKNIKIINPKSDEQYKDKVEDYIKRSEVVVSAETPIRNGRFRLEHVYFIIGIVILLTGIVTFINRRNQGRKT